MKIVPRCLLASLLVVVLGLTSMGSLGNEGRSTSPERSLVQVWVQDDTIHVPAFDLPLSGFLSAETRAVLKRQSAEVEEQEKACPGTNAGKDTLECLKKHYYPGAMERFARFKVNIQPETIAGVPTEIITPVDGISGTNRQRVLINVRGGLRGRRESIPIAAMAKIKIVSVDLRTAFERRFPAASEDVARVYKALLDDYSSEDIGIFGGGGSAILAAQSVAWFQKDGLPAPGAIAMISGAAFLTGSMDDDSYVLHKAIAGSSRRSVAGSSYYGNVDSKSPLVSPVLAPEVMARFPDSVLITSTRDLTMSSAVVTHSQLVKLGVKADLHVWEGLGHSFFTQPDLPEAREAYDVVVRFFDKHLGNQ